jgi:hypothetical protein
VSWSLLRQFRLLAHASFVIPTPLISIEYQMQFIVDTNKKSLLTEAMSNRPKVLVPEKVSPDGLALLKKTLDVHEKKGLSADEILSIIGTSIFA